jgi:hypothetical protein
MRPSAHSKHQHGSAHHHGSAKSLGCNKSTPSSLSHPLYGSHQPKWHSPAQLKGHSSYKLRCATAGGWIMNFARCPGLPEQLEGTSSCPTDRLGKNTTSPGSSTASIAEARPNSGNRPKSGGAWCMLTRERRRSRWVSAAGRACCASTQPIVNAHPRSLHHARSGLDLFPDLMHPWSRGHHAWQKPLHIFAA